MGKFIRTRIEFLSEANYDSALKSGDIQELLEIGTEEDYKEYLDTVFPDSKIKQVMFHKTGAEKFDEFRLSYLGGAYFSFYDMGSGSKYLPKFIQRLLEKRTVLAKVNVKSPLVINRDNAAEIMKKTGLTTQSVAKLKKHFDMSQYDSILGYPNELKDKGELDSVKKSLEQGGDIEVDLSHLAPKYRDVVELAVFDPKDIHILGSKRDVEGFRRFMENKNS
jgi:hypothetical protein